MTNGIAIKQPTLAVELGQRQPHFVPRCPLISRSSGSSAWC